MSIFADAKLICKIGDQRSRSNCRDHQQRSRLHKNIEINEVILIFEIKINVLHTTLSSDDGDNVDARGGVTSGGGGDSLEMRIISLATEMNHV